MPTNNPAKFVEFSYLQDISVTVPFRIFFSGYWLSKKYPQLGDKARVLNPGPSNPVTKVIGFEYYINKD